MASETGWVRLFYLQPESFDSIWNAQSGVIAGFCYALTYPAPIPRIF